MFSVSLCGHFNSLEKLKTMLMQNFEVTNKEHMVCYGIFWSGQLDFSTIKLQVITIRFFFYYNFISSFTTNRFFMSISFFLMYAGISNFFISLGWAPRMNPSVQFAPFPFGHKSQSPVFKLFLPCRHISFSLILPKKIWNM